MQGGGRGVLATCLPCSRVRALLRGDELPEHLGPRERRGPSRLLRTLSAATEKPQGRKRDATDSVRPRGSLRSQGEERAEVTMGGEGAGSQGEG